MPEHQVPFFLSSATNHGVNSSNTKFTVHVTPPVEIPGNATSARAFIQTATIPMPTEMMLRTVVEMYKLQFLLVSIR